MPTRPSSSFSIPAKLKPDASITFVGIRSLGLGSIRAPEPADSS
ncbi:MAG: hypothetical protein QM704_14065 [Anaeromyxobacteraceae bacterium]